MGELLDIDGKPITIADLWAVSPGNGRSAGSTGQIDFTSWGKTNPRGVWCHRAGV